jgi:hypothetical protein
LTCASGIAKVFYTLGNNFHGHGRAAAGREHRRAGGIGCRCAQLSGGQFRFWRMETCPATGADPLDSKKAWGQVFAIWLLNIFVSIHSARRFRKPLVPRMPHYAGAAFCLPLGECEVNVVRR